MTTMRTHIAAAGAAVAIIAPSAVAQSLADRVNSAGEGQIQFSYAARPGVCGNGRSFISIGGNTFIGSYTSNDGVVREACDGGGVRVVINRAGGTITAVETFVGVPAPGSVPPSGARDLGRVGARQAAEYLLSLAARSEGRPSRDAIMPAAIADSADVWQPLLAIARDAARPRETRTTALTWVGRAAGDLRAAPIAPVAAALVSLAGDQDAPRPVREQAMSTLSRFPRGEGVPALIQMVNSEADTWLGRRAMSSLASSGDPRAREFLRQIASRDNVDEEIRYTAIRGIGGNYTTGQDMAFLRQLFPRITDPTAKDAVISAAADQGGRENVQFLLNVTANPTESATIRRRALQSAGRAEAPIGDLVGLYARVDRTLREELINIYSRRTEAVATDRLIEIAKAEEDQSLRRKAITALSRSDDPRVVAALRQIIVP